MFPTSGIDALAYSYLDNYDLDGNGSADYSYQVQGLSGEASPTAMLRGIPTMLRSRTVGQGLSNIWLIRVMFYDKNGRSIQVQSNNQLTSAVSDIATNVPDFTGVTRIAKVTKVAASVSTTVLSTFSYDHMYRATAVDQAYNGGSVMRVAAYEYNELGQLVKKNLKQVKMGTIPYHVTLGTAQSVVSGQTVVKQAQNEINMTPEFLAASGSDFTAEIRTNYLQAVDYRYNIRGQMVNINNSKLVDDNGVTNNDANDLFGVDILYNTVDANVGNTAQWSGRISAVKWMSRNTDYSKTNERSYKYSYDVLNRLNSGTYAERGSAGGGSFNINTAGFNESGITYDDNGNILSLQRNSSSVGATSNIQVDDLTYTYDTDNPNRLKKVVDGVGAGYVSYGFRNLTGSSSDYGYDSSGNLTTDPYKGLTITYNELNRANQITITTATNRYIRYTYDSGGQLLRKQAYDNAVLQKTTDYIDGFVYENSTLAYFAIPEGRVINVSGTLTPEFVIADQQGNARISFRDDGSGKAVVVQENSYYAFGLTFATSPVGTPAVPNKNLYNGGSEWQNDFSNLPDYYNTFFRNYDQALGRFVSLDPMAEAAESLTGYNYSGNNPVMFNDPLGDRVFEKATYQELVSVFADCDMCRGDGGWSDAFIQEGVFGSSAAKQQQLLNDARNGDPAAIAAYVASMGATTITDRGQINSILSAIGDTYVWNDKAGEEAYRNSWTDELGRSHIDIFYNGGWVKAKGNQAGKLSLEQGGLGKNEFNQDVLNAVFSVYGTPAKGLQMIQTVSISTNGKTFTNLVDGANLGNPYYYTPQQIRDKYFSTWFNTAGIIRAYDRPDAQLSYNIMRFETLIVAVNFNNTGVDKVLGAFQWGWSNFGKTPLTRSLNLSPAPSAVAIETIRKFFPNYRFK